MIIVHHLIIGRSIFTVWLLEELGLEYELRARDTPWWHVWRLLWG